MIYDYTTVPVGVPVYGFAYKVDVAKKRMVLKCEPKLGIIKENMWYKKEFTELKKNGEESKRAVNARSRNYASLYQEAVEEYNALIQCAIDGLEIEIELMKLDKIY